MEYWALEASRFHISLQLLRALRFYVSGARAFEGSETLGGPFDLVSLLSIP